MGIFKKSKNKVPKRVQKSIDSDRIEDLTVEEILKYIPHCKAINSKSVLEFKEDGRSWLNPNNQSCFNAGWLTKQDYVDWARGTGRIVKGKTQEIKDEVMYYAKMSEKLDFSLFMYFEYLDLIDELEHSPAPNLNWNSVKPFDLNLDEEEIILKFAKSWAAVLYSRLEYMESDRVKREFREEWYGCAYTLSLLGFGKFGACNTPCIITNLSWLEDLIFTRAYYEHLTTRTDIRIPEIKLVRSLRYND